MHDDQGQEDKAVEEIVRHGPSGTWAVAGAATFVVLLVYLLFYFLAYLPRGVME